MATLFISDLHLGPQYPDSARLFEQFMQHHLSQAEAVYILGDLFDAWVGDDVSPSLFDSAIKQLREAAQHDLPIYVMHGNRDFLLGEGFEKATGCQLVSDPMVINLYGQRTVLTHGDGLCTNDVEYQRFRNEVRSEHWRRRFLSFSPEARLATARGLREESMKRTQEKEPSSMDATQSAVESLLREHGAHRLIHGHTHLPAIHDFLLDGQQARRYVLGDWTNSAEILRCDPRGCRLQHLALT